MHTPYTPPDVARMNRDEIEELFNELLAYEWDPVGYSIMQCYPQDKEGMFRALSRHKAHLDKTNQSRLQTKLL